MATTPDLERAYKALSGKKSSYDQLFRYYDGDQPLVYSTTKLREMFKGIKAHFSENWCAVVVDAVLDRLELKGFACEDQKAADLLNELWSNDNLDLDADEAHEAALVCGEGFLIAWEDGSAKPTIYENDPRMVHIFYRHDAPKEKEFAAKWWEGADERLYMTLYYPDRFEHYVSAGTAAQVQNASALAPDPDTPEERNESGVVPVFHFRRRRRRTLGELANVTDVQDAINKLFADMMVAAEFAAFKQRWVIASADTSNLKNGPNELWEVPAGDGEGQPSSVGQFEASDLANFLNAMDNLAGKVGVITRTPKHFLFMQGGDPSGESLLAAESPLNKKVEAWQKRLSAVWCEAASFLCKLSGLDVPAADITALWEDPRTVQPKTEADTIKVEVEAGIPLTTSLRRHGWDEDDLDQLDKDKKAGGNEGSQAAAMLDAMRLAQQRAQVAQQPPPEGQPLSPPPPNQVAP